MNKSIRDFINKITLSKSKPSWKVMIIIYWEDLRDVLCKPYRIAKSFYYNIVRTIDYIPTVWNDYDYDSGSMFPLLLKKLERIDKDISRGWSVNSETTCIDIKYAIFLLYRIINNECYYKESENSCPDFKAYEIAEKMEKEDKEKLFNLLRDKHDFWWD